MCLLAFRAVVEATASYEWLVGLIEPLSDRALLASQLGNGEAQTR